MISVIIPAFNEEKTIFDTLQSLQKQNTKHKFEVIVVDNNSVDKTALVARQFINKLPLRILKESRQGRGSARVRGAKEAKGDILAYVDADTEVSNGWLNAIEECMRNKENIAATGPWKVNEVKGFTKWFLEDFQEFAQFPYRIVKGYYWLNGMNMAIKKWAYDKCGGFNPVLNAHEDIDISNRLGNIGKVVYCKDMLVVTSGRRYKKGLLSGLWTYQKTAILYFWLGRENINLENRR